MIELLVVVSIIGILASVAIPNFIRYQLKAKTTEAVILTESLAYLERVRILEVDEALAAGPSPAEVPGAVKASWQTSPAWEDLGFAPAGEIYFQYRVELPVADDKTVFVVTAKADLDGDGELMTYTIDGRTMKLSRDKAIE